MSENCPAVTKSGNNLPRWVVAALLTLAIINFIAITLSATTRWDPWSNPDAEHYLHIARRIRAGKGFTSRGPDQFHPDQWMTHHPETARNPLFPYLLSLVPGPDEGFVVRARLLNIAVSVILLVAMFLVGRRLVGERAALVGVIGLSLVDCLIYLGGEAMVEPLLAVWFLSFFFMAVNISQGPKYWLAAGVFAALAWLTKGTGLVLVVAFVVMALLSRLSTKRAAAAVGGVVAAFLLIGSPLMVRNIYYYGDPLYNANTRHTMWMDSFDTPGGGWTMLYDESTRPSRSRYLATHSAQQILSREATGLPYSLYWLMQAHAIRIPKLHSWVRAVVGGPVLVLALIGLVGERRRNAAVLMWFVLGASWLSVAWYHAIGRCVYLWFFLLPLLFLYAGAALVRLGDGRLRKLLGGATPALAVVIFAIVVAGGQVYAWRNVPRSPFVPPPIPVSTRLAHQWQIAHIAESDVVFGRDIDRTETYIPNYRNFSDFQQAARRFGVRYLVIDTHFFQARRHIFAGYIKAKGKRLALHTPMPGWELVYQTPREVPENQPHYLIFERLPPGVGGLPRLRLLFRPRWAIPARYAGTYRYPPRGDGHRGAYVRKKR